MSTPSVLVTDRLDEVLEDYIKAHPLKKRSIENKRRYVRRFQKWLNKTYDGPQTDIDRVKAWMDHLARNMVPESVRVNKSAILSLMDFAIPGGMPRPKLVLRKQLRSDNLKAILRDYKNARQLCKKERERMEAHVAKFNRWLRDRGMCYEDESESTRVSEWLASLAEKHQPETVNNYRQTLLRLLRFATPDGEALPRADRIRRQREPDKHKPAFTHEELALLIAAAPKFKPTSNLVQGRGTIRSVIPHCREDGIEWGMWWEAFIRVAYESGQYLSDLCLLRWDQMDREGAISFVRHKTGRAITFQLSEEAVAAARALGSRELILPWPYNLEAYFPRKWKEFIRTVPGVRSLGAKSIRRSAITYAYMTQGEEAARTIAGHASFSTTQRHYVDWSLAKRSIYRPPAILV